MAWIESHQELAAHPKTRKLARLLDVSIPTAIGHLHCLWWWALDYAQDGDISRHEPEDIAIAALWEGDPGLLLTALRAARFIDDGRCLHDWDDYAGKLIDRRVRNRERMKAARTTPVPATYSARALHVHDTERARVQLQNTTEPNTTEQNPTEQDQTVPERTSPGAEAPSRAPRTPSSKKPGLIPLTGEEVQRLEAEFSGKLSEPRSEIELAVSHEAARKYPTNQYGYVRNWLRRAAEFQAERHPPPPPPREQADRFRADPMMGMHSWLNRRTFELIDEGTSRQEAKDRAWAEWQQREQSA